MNSLIYIRRLYVLPIGNELPLITRNLLPHLHSAAPASPSQRSSSSSASIDFKLLCLALLIIAMAVGISWKVYLSPIPPLPIDPSSFSSITVPDFSSALQNALIDREVECNKTCISRIVYEAITTLNSSVLQKYNQTSDDKK
jgi:hypothetical protein